VSEEQGERIITEYSDVCLRYKLMKFLLCTLLCVSYNVKDFLLYSVLCACSTE